MFKKLQVAVVLSCMISYATAGTVAIGTASARGDMRVDSYMVKGNATLFDGSVVETGQATADLRLQKGTEIMMATDSRGTLHPGRLVLQKGQSEFAANSSFQLQANGLHITPIDPDSRGVVSLKAGSTVEVSSLKGSLGVTNENGVLLASVRPGRSLSFAIAGGSGAPADTFEIVGVVSFENGHYYLTAVDGTKYELKGKDFKKYKDTKVVVVGVLGGGGPTSAAGIPLTVTVTSIALTGAVAGASAAATAWIIVGAGATAAGIGAAVYVAQKPASR